MTTQMMMLNEINPAPYNPRIELKPGDQQYEALKRSIDRFGLVEPLIVNTRTGTLVGGHQRYNVLLAAGETATEVVVVDLDERREKELNIALNKISGIWDFEKLDALFETMEQEDILFAGFAPEEISSMYDDVETPSYGEIQTTPAAEKAPPKFTVYLSFGEREAAEEWLAARGLSGDFGSGRTVSIEMQGSEYGTD